MRTNIDTHVKEMNSFLEVSNHLKTILNGKEIDRNGLYDLIYCRKKLLRLLTSGKLENKDIENNATELVHNIDIIVKTINVDDVYNKKSVNIKDLNKSKYGNTNKFKGLTDNTKDESVEKGDLKKYLRSKTLTIAFVVILIIVLFSGAIDSIYNTLVGAENFDGEMLSIIKFGGLLSKVCFSSIIAYTLLSLGIDIVYIKFPNFRTPNDIDVISYEALDSVKSCTMNKQVDTRDRIEVAEALLHNMLKKVRELIKYHVEHGLSIENYDESMSKLELIESELNTIEMETNSESLIEKIEAYVKAELLYENNKEIMDFSTEIAEQESEKVLDINYDLLRSLEEYEKTRNLVFSFDRKYEPVEIEKSSKKNNEAVINISDKEAIQRILDIGMKEYV